MPTIPAIDVHDRASADPAHRRCDGLDAEEGTVQVDPEQPVEGRLRLALDRCGVPDAGVVDQDVEAAEPVHGPGDHPAPLRGVGHVVPDEQSVLAELGGDGPAVLLQDVGQYDAGAGLGEHPCLGGSLAASRTGDDCHPAVE